MPMHALYKADPADAALLD